MLVTAVKCAKRSWQYRRYRPALSSIAPEDVWQDSDLEQCLISFRAGWHECEEVFLVFSVQTGTRGSVIDASFVALSADPTKYIASNLGDAADRLLR